MTKASELVYGTLRRRVMAGAYEPGTQLKEEALAAEMSVSRTPVRMAFHRLIDEGLLVARANRGVFIAGWTQRDIDDVMELRLLLEPHAARLAAERATPEQLADLQESNDRMERFMRGKAVDRLTHIQAANNRFHQIILDAAGSPRLKRMSQSLVDMPVIIGSFYFYSESDLRQSIRHHQDLIMAITSRDGLLAQHAMVVHLRSANNIYVRHRAGNTGASAEQHQASLPGEVSN